MSLCSELPGFDRWLSSVQSGRAIQHVKENIFTAEGGVRRGIPNVLVVLTDGRSQDDVNKVSKEMQMEGREPCWLLFLIWGLEKRKNSQRSSLVFGIWEERMKHMPYEASTEGNSSTNFN